MGCDIHLYHEKWKDGKWITADNWSQDKYNPPGRLTVDFHSQLYTDRNYRLFGVLANVRNGFGFAGIKTGDPVIPITMPRGIPKDACPEYLSEVESWGVDGHSHSWLTLNDLNSYPWKSAKKLGFVPLETYHEWKASGGGNPHEYCGDVSGPGIEKISETLAAAVNPSKLPEAAKGKVYVAASWATSLKDDCHRFLQVVVPRLKELEEECGAGNARITFFFDN